MKQQDDLSTLARFTSAIVSATGDLGAKRPDYKMDVMCEEVAESSEGRLHTRFVEVRRSVLAAKADMARDTASLLSQVAELDAAAKSSVKSANDMAGKMAQSLQRTKDMMGPQVEERLTQLERFVACMDRLHELEQDGTLARLAPVIKR